MALHRQGEPDQSRQGGTILSARDYVLCPARNIFQAQSISHIKNAILNKLVLSRWQNVCLDLLLHVYEP